MNFLRKNVEKAIVVFAVLMLAVFAFNLTGNAPQEISTVEQTADNYEQAEEIKEEAEEPETEAESVDVPNTSEEEKKELYCTLSVRCDTILSDISQLDEKKQKLVGKDGVIFPQKHVKFEEGESVFDVLLREMKENKIHLEFVNTPIYNSVYIEGIGNIYEFDAGELSGWMYKVNGEFPNFGCSKYILKNGDSIEFVYTCDLGKDVGGDYYANNGE